MFSSLSNNFSEGTMLFLLPVLNVFIDRISDINFTQRRIESVNTWQISTLKECVPILISLTTSNVISDTNRSIIWKCVRIIHNLSHSSLAATGTHLTSGFSHLNFRPNESFFSSEIHRLSVSVHQNMIFVPAGLISDSTKQCVYNNVRVKSAVSDEVCS